LRAHEAYVLDIDQPGQNDNGVSRTAR
jgi:hypothetical protein